MATSSRRAVSAPLRPQSASCDWCAVAPELLGGRDAVKPGMPTLRTVGTGDHTKRPRLLRRRAHPPRPLHASRAFPVLRPLSHDSSHCCGASRTGLSHHKRSMVPSASVQARCAWCIWKPPIPWNFRRLYRARRFACANACLAGSSMTYSYNYSVVSAEIVHPPTPPARHRGCGKGDECQGYDEVSPAQPRPPTTRQRPASHLQPVLPPAGDFSSFFFLAIGGGGKS